MAAELRWILLALCGPLLVGIWWWTARKSGHAPGDSVLREPTVPKQPETPAPAPDRARPEPGHGLRIAALEPLDVRLEPDPEDDHPSMHTDFEHVPVLDAPMMVHPEPAASTHFPAAPAGRAEPLAPQSETPSSMPAASAAGAAAPAPLAPAAERSTAAPGAPNPPRATPEKQRIVTLRVCAPGEVRWSGAQLLAALELHGLAYGKFQIFHRKHTDGQTLYCVASLIEPGTFDLAAMESQEFRGVTLFAVLPGPIEPSATLDDLLLTARGLAQELSGMVQDGKGIPLSPQRSAALREDIARFQAALPQPGPNGS